MMNLLNVKGLTHSMMMDDFDTYALKVLPILDEDDEKIECFELTFFGLKDDSDVKKEFKSIDVDEYGLEDIILDFYTHTEVNNFIGHVFAFYYDSDEALETYQTVISKLVEKEDCGRFYVSLEEE